MTDAPFVPEPYVSHMDGWRAAYLSLFGPMEDDEEIKSHREEIRRTSEATRQKVDAALLRRGIQSAKMKPSPKPATDDVLRSQHISTYWADPTVFLFGSSDHQFRNARRLKTRDALLQKLVSGEIKAYSPVALSTSTVGYHQTLNLPIAGAVEPVSQLGIWASKSGVQALSSGRVFWAFSSFDTAQERPLFFSKSELSRAFPVCVSKGGEQSGKTLPERVAQVLLNRFPEGIGGEYGAIKDAKGKIEDELGESLSTTTFSRGRELARQRRP